MSRRKRLVPGLVLSGVLATLGAMAGERPVIEVWKTPTCGCCKAWVRHVEDAGFLVKVTQLDDVAPVKRRFKVPPELSSCHTAVVDGFVIEGHVPAQDIVRLLKERPKVTGIYVPGMPIGSPGMEGPNGEKYDVLALDDAGNTRVFATHAP
jgi:hypothetical protein